MMAADFHQETAGPRANPTASASGRQAQLTRVYDCYYLNRHLEVLSHEKIQCADDQSAASEARDRLGRRSCAGIEVWERGRMITQLLRRIEPWRRFESR